jgi:RNA polymerase sigma-70 factor (ECF subfamily)
LISGEVLMEREGFNPDWPKLMAETQQGLKESYKRLLDEISPVLYKYIKKRISNADDVDDVYQTVLMKVHRARATYDLTVPFEPWMFAIARNSIADFFKANKRHRETFSSNIGQEGILIELSVEYGDEKMIFNEAISQMTPKQKEAFILTKVNGLSIEDAAEKTGLSITAFKARTFKAYKIFKTAFLDNPL